MSQEQQQQPRQQQPRRQQRQQKAKYSAVLRNVRVTSRKAGLMADFLRGKSVSEALDALKVLNKQTSPMFSKLINSAMANATSQATVDVDRLYVSDVYADQAATWKRFRFASRGRVVAIKKRSSHLTVKLQER